MCGIVGALTFNNSDFKVTAPYIVKMRDCLIHRGPDSQGEWVSKDSRIGLGHRRLSIIDLSRQADQPMSNEDSSLQIVFNGEIYNHAQIRQELNKSRKAHTWKTGHSDTEVILHSFEEWGIDCLRKFRGMFAIALWDVKLRELWLIRDRIGIKPLYYSIHNNRITFASEIKALLKDPGQERQVDDESFYHYLSFLCVPAPSTMFKGIKKLAAGTWLRIKEDGRIYESRYWDVWESVSPLNKIPEQEIADLLLEELRVSVNLRKVSDVPVGIFLSGGIDSSTNLALFSEGAKNQEVKSFSIGYAGDCLSYKNELGFARKMAQHVAAKYHERLLSSDDLIDLLPGLAYMQDEPIADPVCVPIYYVSKLARENGVTVCQVGEGADELFWGYPEWRSLLGLSRFNDLPAPLSLKKLGLLGLKLSGKQEQRYFEWLRRATLAQPIFWSGAEGFSETEKRGLLSANLSKKFAKFSSWEVIEPIHKRFQQGAWEKSHLNWMTYADLNLRLPELLLMRIDKMSMANSLEARVPFLDHKLVELSMAVPENIKTRDNSLKYILKKAVRGVIPDEFIDRKKQGFSVPLEDWFSQKLGAITRGELLEFCQAQDFLDRQAVTRLLDRGFNQKAWYLLNFALWWKEFICL